MKVFLMFVLIWTVFMYLFLSLFIYFFIYFFIYSIKCVFIGQFISVFGRRSILNYLWSILSLVYFVFLYRDIYTSGVIFRKCLNSSSQVAHTSDTLTPKGHLRITNLPKSPIYACFCECKRKWIYSIILILGCYCTNHWNNMTYSLCLTTDIFYMVYTDWLTDDQMGLIKMTKFYWFSISSVPRVKYELKYDFL